MVNPWLSLAGLGMITVGIASFIYWHKPRRIKPAFYIAGLIAWFLSILIKVILDLTITSVILGSIPKEYSLLTSCIYYGLRTGILEVGILYIILIKLNLKKPRFEEAVGIGISFGATEAILLGLSYMINIIIFYMMPQLIEQVPEQQREFIEASLNLDTLVIFAPIIERISTLIIHITAAILVVLSLRQKPSYLLAAIAYKSIVDGIIPIIKPLLMAPSISNYYLAEIPFIIIAALSLPLMKIAYKKW